MKNAEGKLREYLASMLGVTVAVSVPSTRPDRFVTLELTGNSHIGNAHDAVSLVLDCWGKSRSDAFALASDTKDAIENIGAAQVGWTAGIAPNSGGVSIVHYPDVETTAERYELTVTLVIH